jgi:hypothetical protein
MSGNEHAWHASHPTGVTARLDDFRTALAGKFMTLRQLNQLNLDGFRPAIMWFLMLPAGVLGLALIIFEKLSTPNDSISSRLR